MRSCSGSASSAILGKNLSDTVPCLGRSVDLSDMLVSASQLIALIFALLGFCLLLVYVSLKNQSLSACTEFCHNSA